MLADGTGGFVIVNNNDLLAGMEKIGDRAEPVLHHRLCAFRIGGRKLPHAQRKGGQGLQDSVAQRILQRQERRMLLAGKPTEMQLETRIQAPQPGDLVAPGPQVTYFFTGPDTARVDLAMDIPIRQDQVRKGEGQAQTDVNILRLGL